MTLFSRILLLALVLGIVSAISLLIPNDFSTTIDTNIIYLLGYINQMGYFVHIDTVFFAIKFIGNFTFSVLMFYGILWFFKMLK